MGVVKNYCVDISELWYRYGGGPTSRGPKGLANTGGMVGKFMMSTGIIVLDGILQEINPKLYFNFLLLQNAIYIMCNRSLISQETIRIAHDCLFNFINTSIDIYGESMIVYNVHGLLHWSVDVSRFGSLDNYSCFPFENYMKTIKRLCTMCHPHL